MEFPWSAQRRPGGWGGVTMACEWRVVHDERHHQFHNQRLRNQAACGKMLRMWNALKRFWQLFCKTEPLPRISEADSDFDAQQW
jgi:hypothetical protein